MGKKVTKGKLATVKIRESQVRSQPQVHHGRSYGHAEGSPELPSHQGKKGYTISHILHSACQKECSPHTQEKCPYLCSWWRFHWLLVITSLHVSDSCSPQHWSVLEELQSLWPLMGRRHFRDPPGRRSQPHFRKVPCIVWSDLTFWCSF